MRNHILKLFFNFITLVTGCLKHPHALVRSEVAGGAEEQEAAGLRRTEGEGVRDGTRDSGFHWFPVWLAGPGTRGSLGATREGGRGGGSGRRIRRARLRRGRA